MDTMTTTMTTPGTADEAVPGGDDALVMSLLHEHVPLALLCDLTAPEGPSSREILDTEGEPAQRWWE
jgi:hypothetical protein